MAPRRALSISIAACGLAGLKLVGVSFTAPTSWQVSMQIHGEVLASQGHDDSDSSGTAQPALAAASTAAILGMGAALCQTNRLRRNRTSMKYTTKQILPFLQWIKTGVQASDIEPSQFDVRVLAGCDICFGKTESGKLFAIGDKAPPTGVSFSIGGELEGDTMIEAQYGNRFNVFSGNPEGEWCPNPPILGKAIAAFMGDEAQAIATFEIREAGFFGGGELEIQIDTNAKAAYEADYWKGILDAQGKNDGTYY